MKEISAIFSNLEAEVHFHPYNSLEPSKPNLILTNAYYEMYTKVDLQSVLTIIGNGNDTLDLLVLDQITDLNSELLDQNWLSIENNRILKFLPRCLQDQNVPIGIISQLCNFINRNSHLPPHQFNDRVKRYIEKLPYREKMDPWELDFYSNITILPEYVPSVVGCLGGLGCYKVGLMRYDSRTKELSILKS